MIMTQGSKQSLNELFKQTRINNQLSSSEMADRLEISLTTLSKIENGLRQVDAETLLSLMQLFNISPSLEEVEHSNKTSLPTYTNDQYVEKTLDQMQLIMEEFPKLREEPFKGNPLKEMIVDELPLLITNGFYLDENDYKVTGSIGKGQFAEVPWLCVFLKDITKSATKGYYIVFLFSTDGKSVYMSLNQGWTFFHEKYGTKIARKKIQVTAQSLKNELSLNENEWITGPIDLQANGILAKGYEVGNIFAKRYSLSELPNMNQFKEDFYTLLQSYNEINLLRGKRSVDEFTESLLLLDDGLFFDEDEDEDFNINVQKELTTSDDEVGITQEEDAQKARQPVIQKGGKPKYTRRVKVAAAALKDANYKCALDENHITFTNKSSGKPYVEAHHLIHLSTQAEFEYELDCIENIVSLCPTCHRLLHHGADHEKEQSIEALYEIMVDGLSNKKIYLPLPELKKLYQID
jgi:5-methylcytosine-specific restriction protein A